MITNKLHMVILSALVIIGMTAMLGMDFRMGIRTLIFVVCSIFLTYDLTRQCAIGKPIPWLDVPEGVPFRVQQELGDGRLLVEFWPGGDRYIAGYSRVHVGSGWHCRRGEYASSVKDPRPSDAS